MVSTVRVTFKSPQGKSFPVDASVGETLMQSAIRNNVPGIEAECGGCCICATCHVYCGENDGIPVGVPDEQEEEMLQQAAAERRETSRLSCQIKVTPAIGGAVFRVPETQY